MDIKPTNLAPLIFIAVLALTGCQSTRSDEMADKKNNPQYVLVRSVDEEYQPVQTLKTGSINDSLRAVWQYGLLAAAAYDETPAPSGKLDPQCRYDTQYSARWRRLRDYSENTFSFEKPRGQLAVSGYSFGVWQDLSASKHKRVAIVFRGTNFTDWGDWYSNARWITRFNILTADQYQLTRELVAQMVPRLQDEFGSNVEIIAVGHSLGGGLAQHAGYSSPYISTVYAFASSPVTGHISFDQRINEQNRKDLEIFRINESGEIVAGGRWLHRQVFKLPIKDPRVVELLFSFRQAFYKRQSTGDDTISQHSIRALSCDMICYIEHEKGSDKCMKDL